MRIVSLCPSTTETLIDLGLADSLVGVTRYCIHPRDVTRALPKIGGTKDPDVDAILRAKPDVVFLNEEENTRAIWETLAAKVDVDVTFPRTVADVPRTLRHFGERTGTRERAEERARALEDALARLEAKVARSSGARFAYLIWRDPWMTVNGDTYVSDLLERAGGRNVFGGASVRYPAFELDELAALRPDVVLLPDEPYRFRLRDAAELVSGDDCCWHGVRSIRGVALAERLFGAVSSRA
ncbi:helical backbone metal receptor [Myxococcota bacterium]|nr:helical backbone metal receptor [Myxococcota bacterium]